MLYALYKGTNHKLLVSKKNKVKNCLLTAMDQFFYDKVGGKKLKWGNKNEETMFSDKLLITRALALSK